MAIKYPVTGSNVQKMMCNIIIEKLEKLPGGAPTPKELRELHTVVSAAGINMLQKPNIEQFKATYNAYDILKCFVTYNVSYLLSVADILEKKESHS